MDLGKRQDPHEGQLARCWLCSSDWALLMYQTIQRSYSNFEKKKGTAMLRIAHQRAKTNGLDVDLFAFLCYHQSGSLHTTPTSIL
jgi:hypothetical protein